MILIKDRHGYDALSNQQDGIGKYDTYKGSTLENFLNYIKQVKQGNMILIKDRHHPSGIACML